MRTTGLFCLALLCCGPSAPDAKSPASAGKLNCDNEFHLDALNVKGGGGFGAFRVDGAVETKAVRQINDSVISYGVQAKRLCEEYNAGAVTREEYSTRSENLRRRLAGVPELRDQLDGALKSGDVTAQKRALHAAYAGLVPDEERTELEAEFAVEVALPESLDTVPPAPCSNAGLKRGAVKVLGPGDSVPSGALIGFRVRVTRPAYVYLFQQNEKTKETTTLFPSARIPIAEPVPAAQVVRIPHDSAGYCVNEKDLGLERVYVVASLEPVQRLEKYSKSSSSQEPIGLEGLGTSQRANNGCTRALELVETKGSACTRSRGLVLESNEPAKAGSFRAVSEAADNTIVKVFAFEHVTPGDYKSRGPQGVTGKSRGILIEE